MANLRLTSLGLLLVVAVLAPGVRHLRVAFDLEAMYASFSDAALQPTASLLLISPPERAEAVAGAVRAVDGVQSLRFPRLDEDLLAQVPAEQQEQARHALAGKPATQVVPIALTVERPAPLAAIRAVTDAPIVGTPVLDEAHERSAKLEQTRLLPAIACALLVALLGVLRRPLDALVVLGSVGLGVLALAGTLGWLGLALGGPNLMLLPLIAVIGLADSLHLLREAASLDGPAPQRAWRALRRVAGPCALTSVTTALAFLALTTSDARPIRVFGLLAAYGMVLAFLTGLLFPAAVLTWTPTPGARSWMERAVRSLQRPPIWSLLFLLLLAPALARLSTDLKLGGELSDHDPDLAAQRHVDEALGGVFPMRLTLESDMADGTADPQVAFRLVQLQQRLEKDPAVGAVLSYADALRWMATSRGRRVEQLVGRRGSPEARERRYQSAHQRALDAGVADTPLPLFDDDRSAFYVYLRYRDVGARAWRRSIHFLEGFNKTAPEVRLEMDGYVPLAVQTLDRLGAEAFRVVGATLSSAVFVVALRFRRWRAVLPVVFILAGTVGVALCTMGLLGQPLNHLNLFVLSLAIGLGVDAWLHLQDHGDDAIAAVVWTTFVLCVGFASLQLSSLPSVRRIGLILLASTSANAWISLALHQVGTRALRAERQMASTTTP